MKKGNVYKREIIEQDGKFYLIYRDNEKTWEIEINEDEAKFLGQQKWELFPFHYIFWDDKNETRV